MKRGVFVVFEGLDRCGKTTQIEKAKEFFKTKGLPVKEMCFPDRSTIVGGIIDQFLRKKAKNLNDQTVHLLYSTNRWEKREEMLETLKKGTSIICSRYAYSGVAYTSAKGLDLKWCMTCDIGLPLPDCVIFLDTESMKTISSRPGFGDEVYEKEPFQNLVRKQFLKMIELDKEEKRGDHVFRVIDASKSIKEVSMNVSRELENVVKTLKRTGKEGEDDIIPMKKLWEKFL